ncbi:MAG TPA: hypothetical protein VNY73_05515 [Bacteroidia bacterium]|jgi:hypothetical protein|nr:hypothetical protein [Bacteroidia bacterium]
MERTKINNFILGISSGLLLPLLSIMGYWLWSYKYMRFYPQFFSFLLMGRVLSAVISLCLIPNLGLFFLFINKEYYKSCRGMILSTLLYGFLIVYLKMWVEHSWGD